MLFDLYLLRIDQDGPALYGKYVSILDNLNIDLLLLHNLQNIILLLIILH